MHAEAVDLERAARNYQATLARVAGVAVDAPRPPRLDLVWLGMGRDGHTASLFPGMAALGERRRWVVASVASPTSSPPGRRMTLTFPILNAARAALLVVTGADKAAALRSVRTGSTTLPVGSEHAESTLWLVDAAAAGEAA